MSAPRPSRRSALLSFRFLFSAAAGSLASALVAAFGSVEAQLAVLGCLVSVVGGLFLAYLGQEEERERRRNAAVESLAAPLALAADPDLFRVYRAVCDGLTAVARQPDPLLRDAALEKFASVADQIAGLAQGRVTFALSEGWRTLYEKLIRAPGLKAYRSVAWVRSPDYWQDAPGRRSMAVNFDAAEDGLPIDRVVILRDDLWPADEPLPRPDVFPWIEEQHNHGLRVSVVRESELAREPDLLADIGIYGTRAVGTQELDERSRTLRFTLDLDPRAVAAADGRWRRLLLYAVSVRSLLDRAEKDG